MYRRTIVTGAAAAVALAASLGSAWAEGTITLGAAAPQTGPLAGGASVTHWPAVRLWVQQTNEAGGLTVGGQQMTIELVEYDDQTNPQQAIQAAQRMATQDQVDFMVAPYSTGLNLAAAPIFAQLGYPQITGTAVTNQQPELAAQFPNMFFVLGRTSVMAEDTAQVLVDMRARGELEGNRVALVNVADAFGIEMAGISRAVLEENGFEIVYETSYPLGTQDLAPVIDGAKSAEADAFIAWSYPGDTFALTDQAIVQNFAPQVFFTAVATAFPAYGARFGDQIEGVLGMGGVNADDPAFQAFMEAHVEMAGQGPDYWASAATYATLEILGQAIEGANSTDRGAVLAYLQDRSNSYETILGPVNFNENNDNERYWTVGQWQGGVFRGVAARGRDGTVPVQVFDGWE